MPAVIYLVMVAVLAGLLQTRVRLLDSFRGLPRYFCSLGLTLFLVNWANFLIYVAFGWGQLYSRLSWTVLLAAIFGATLLRVPAQPAPSAAAPAPRPWNGWFIFFAVFVLARFYAGLDEDGDGNIWSVFNFVDTAFHLSVANAFLAASHFPPMDLDMAPFPLKYHFLADFNLAHLVKFGLSPLSAIWTMNQVSALAMVGAIWAVFERWLRLPPRWIALGGLLFLFLNPALVNVIHYLALRPDFYDLSRPFLGLLRFPYFNFESMLANMLEPQRGLLFSLPVVLLALHASFGERAAEENDPADRTRTLLAFVLVCLLPLGHIVAFAVLAPCLLPQLWRHRKWFLARYPVWLPALAVGGLQLLYLATYGPPANQAYSGWSTTSLPLQDFDALPAMLRRATFWFFADGDFLFWGLLFAVIALARWPRSPDAAATPGLKAFLVRWRGYFFVTGGFFLLINFYRYSFDWGDSNKFVFFLNLGLALVITLGVADLLVRRYRLLGNLLWGLFFLLCVGPPSYSFYLNVISDADVNGTVLLFTRNGRDAAEWIRQNLPRREPVLTAADNDMHFVTPLAGRPTFAGIYGNSNPYRQNERTEEIRRIYEKDRRELLTKLGGNYLCISRVERALYHLNPAWERRMKSGNGVVFQTGEGPDDFNSIYIFDVRRIVSK